MSELKACPFCGKEPWKKYYPDCIQITCKCGYMSKQSTMPDRLFEYWNTRPLESALQSALTTAQEENKRYKDALESLFGHNSDEGLQEFYTRAYRLVDSLGLIKHHDDNPEVESALNGGKNGTRK